MDAGNISAGLRLGAALLALCATAVTATAQTVPSRTIASAVTQEILTISTPDGLQLPAVLTSPTTGFNPSSPVIVFLPDGPGLSPLKSSDAARYLAEAMTTRGFASLSLETRLTARYAFSRFDEAITDIKAALDALSARGTSSVILAGNGLGALVAARYASESNDGRVKALIMLSPNEDPAESLRKQLGEDRYRKAVDQASKALTEGGRGKLIDLGAGIIATPVVFLDWYGPNSNTTLAANIAGLDKPILLIAGESDSRAPRSRLDALKAAAPKNKKFATKTYPGLARDLSTRKDLIATDVAAWFASHDLEVVARVQTQLVTAVAADGTKLEGVLYRPAAGGDGLKPAFVMTHGWAADVMRSTTHWLAQRLAQNGYAVLSMQHRDSGFRGAVTGKLEDVPQDIAAWSAFMATRGHRSLIGVGHSVGGLWLSTYLAQTKDPRFKAMIYLAPTRDLPMHARLAMGEDRYARTVLEAQDAVREGKGATTLIDAPLPQTVYDEDPRQPMFLSAPGSGFTYYYADAFLSYWGPDSKAMHTRVVPNVKVPILSFGGSRDPTMQGGFLIEFTKAAGANARYVFYGGPGGAPHSFEGFETRVTDDILAWVAQVF